MPKHCSRAGRVALPFADDRKSPHAAKKWGWQIDLWQDGYDIRTVQELLGHRDVATTMI